MQRKTFLAATTTAAALSLGACAQGRGAQLEIVEPSSQFDYAAFKNLVDRPADIRVVFDGGGYHPEILGNIKNAYNGFQFGLGIKPDRIAMALVLHGDGVAYAYDEAIWQKYKIGETFDFKDPSGAFVTSNIFAPARSPLNTQADPNAPESMYQDGTVESLQRRGLEVFVCHVAAAEQASNLAAAGVAAGMTSQRILDDLLGHLNPGAKVVPSGVAIVALLQQRFGYAYGAAS